MRELFNRPTRRSGNTSRVYTIKNRGKKNNSYHYNDSIIATTPGTASTINLIEAYTPAKVRSPPSQLVSKPYLVLGGGNQRHGLVFST